MSTANRGMTKLLSITGKEIIHLLKKTGFIVDRQRGSHIVFKHNDARTTLQVRYLPLSLFSRQN
jgi:predicted RNA binding protein YcfA (HicA-like mRNA interferase family)